MGRQLNAAHNVTGIDRHRHPPQTIRKRHSPDAFRDLLLLDIKFGVRKILDIPKMIEMRMRNEDSVDFFRCHTDFGGEPP